MSPSVETDFIAPPLLTRSGQNIGRIKVSNTAAGTLQISIADIASSLNVRAPAGEGKFSIPPGEEKFFPLYFKIPAGNTDSIHFVTAEIQLTLGDSSWRQTISREIKAEKVTKIICSVPDEDILLNEERREAHLRLTVSNQGNTLKNLIVELESARHSMSYPPVEISLPPGSDTVLIWNKIASYRQLISGEQHYYITVKDRTNASHVYFYQLIRVRSPQSPSQAYGPAFASPTNTIGLRYERWENIQYLSMMGNGRLEEAIKDYGLRYQFDVRKHPYHNAVSVDQLKLEARNEKNTYRLGDIYLGQETGLYNRGVQAEINPWGNIFLSGAYTHSGLMPSTFYNSRNEEIIAAVMRIEGDRQSKTFRYVYQNDRLLNTNAHLLFAGNQRKIGEKGIIESGIGLSAERFKNKTDYDGAAFLNLTYRASRWEVSSRNRYSGPAYPFINRGDTHFRQLLTYKPSGSMHYHAEVLVQRFSPSYRYLSASSTTNYRNTQGKFGVSLYTPGMKYNISAGAGSNQLFAPYLNNSAKYEGYEVFAAGDIHYTRPNLSVQLKQEVSRVIPRVTNTTAYFAGVTELNTVFYNTYLSFYLNKGAFTFFDQANYILNGFTRDFFLTRVFREFHLRPALSVKITADHYRDRVFDYQTSTLEIAPEFRYKSFKFNYEAGYRIANGTGMLLQSLSVFKSFENPLERKYTLRVQTFNDTNGNGLKDAGEPPVEGILLGLGPIRMVTNANGSAELENLPREKYELTLFDKRNFSSRRSRFDVLMGSSQTVQIPLQEGVALSGQVQVTEGKQPVALHYLILQVTNTETGEHAFLPCDHRGRFKTTLQKGNTYQVSLAPSAIPETYVTVPAQQIIHTNGSVEREIIFTLREKKRNIIRKQF